MRAPAFLLLITLAASSCTAVRSSVLRTGPALPPSTAPVTVSATRDPGSGDELGIIEVSGDVQAVTLETLVAELQKRAAELGGDYARIDRTAVRHEQGTVTRTYECGADETVWETRSETRVEADGTTSTTTDTVPVTRFVSRTCTEEVQVELATRTLTGRAFRTAATAPEKLP